MPVKFICCVCGEVDDQPDWDSYEGWLSCHTSRAYWNKDGRYTSEVFCNEYNTETKTWVTCWDDFAKQNNIVLIPKTKSRAAHWRVVDE